MSSQLVPLDEYRDEIDLGQYIRAIWRYRIAILLVTLLSGAVAYWVGSRETPMYRATVRVDVPSGQTTTTGGNPQLARFKALLENTLLAQQIVKEFGLDKPPSRLRASSFLKGTISTTSAGAGTDMLDVSVVLPDPVLAMNVANRYVDITRSLGDRLTRDQRAAVRDILKAQIDEVQTRLAEAEAALQKFRNETQIDLVRSDVNALLNERGNLVSLTTELEAERARVAEAERQLATQEPTIPTRSALSAADATPTLEFRSDSLSPYINPIYQVLQEQLATSRTTVAGLERRRDETVKALKLSAPQFKALSRLYEQEAQLARLEARVTLQRKVFDDLSSSHEQARVQASSPPMSVQVVDPATPPESSITPGPMRSTQVALAVGLVLSMLGALLVDVVIRATGKSRR